MLKPARLGPEQTVAQMYVPEGFRAAVNLRGFQMGNGRQPMSPQQKTDVAALSKTLQCLLSEQGFSDQPIGGCPVSKSPPVDRAEIDAIVHNVLAELKQRGMA
jgi:4-hydroxy-tetrahydrodipicolinate synthase